MIASGINGTHGGGCDGDGDGAGATAAAAVKLIGSSRSRIACFVHHVDNTWRL